MTDDTGMDVWFSRDLPLLRYLVPVVDAQPFAGTTLRQAATELGLTDDVIAASAKALADAYLIDVQWMSGAIGRVTGISPEARQQIGLWPTPETLADRMQEVLEAMLQADIDDAERSKWQAMRDGAMGAGRDVLVQLAAMAMFGHVPR